MIMVEGLQEIELLALILQGEFAVGDVLNEFFDFTMLGIDICPLKGAGQKSRLPVLALLNGITTRAHGNESRKVLIQRAQTIGHPGSKTGPHQPWLTAVHEEQGGFMIWNIRKHRADDTEVIGAFPDFGKNFTDLQP